MEELRSVVRQYPLLDNHAHNLLLPEFQNDSRKFLSVTSEAEGDALADSVHSLAHITARRQLRELYDCDQDDWVSLMAARERLLQQPDELYRKCLHGTHMILIDDGLDRETVHPFEWHSQWVGGGTRRILRLEAAAESIVREKILPKSRMINNADAGSVEVEALFAEFLTQLSAVIDDACSDPQVVGFKSVICYRTGLDVDVQFISKGGVNTKKTVCREFWDWLTACGQVSDSDPSPLTIRLNSKRLNDYILLFAFQRNSAMGKGGSFVKPIQFHTGLGDNDLNLLKANPANLQLLISMYPTVPVILLHASYPYTREAGYLASVYNNVYLDLGLLFPMVSTAGQKSTVRQALELTPFNKLLYSSDGHWFPETYFLAAKQFRLVLEEVLIESIEDRSLTIVAAINAATAILFNNSNKLYRLNIDAPSVQNLAIRNVSERSEPQKGTYICPIEPTATVSRNSAAIAAFERFVKEHKFLEFIYVSWYDYMGTMRARIVPIDEFRRLVQGQNKLSISRGNTGTLQNDFLTSVVNTTGHMIVTPDLRSLKPTHSLDTLRSPGVAGHRRSSATVLSSWCDELGQGLSVCPRKTLISILDQIRTEFGLDVTLGFEVEVTFLERVDDAKQVSPVTKNHSWSTMSPEQWHGLGAIRDIYDGLREIGVEVQGIHAEAGPTQYEFILPPASAVNAIDSLLQSRQVIRQIAYTRGLRATLHPKFANGAHIHMSLNRRAVAGSHSDGSSGEVDGGGEHEWNFFAGLLAHLSAVCAITMPAAESYLRVADNVWSGGTWIAWGTQNRECPLRRVRPGRWEYRPHDGMGNVYLSVSAILSAGLLGLREAKKMTLSDCAENPSRLDEEGRKARGIVERMPAKLDDSIGNLRRDYKLQQVIGAQLVNDYITVKEAEQAMLAEMGEEARENFLIERY